ncbi:MAG: tryptophan synthase subunit alpha [Candidatus Omnitrophota bacterium]|jgi:tryptophan synthase alpha chain
MTGLEKKFRELRDKGKKALIVFITAGYPDLETTYRLLLELAVSGVDIIELGVPFSDPMADGLIIQEASQAALAKGVNLKGILEVVRKARKHTAIPICLMTYYNPVFCFGEQAFIKAAADCGVDGVIIPDLPPEESSSLIAFEKEYKVDGVYFVSPTTPLSRMKYIAGISKGFIYYVSLAGVTGARAKLSLGLIKKVRMLKSCTSKPVCVGFGISTAEQVKEVQSFADGVIVGSAVVKKIKENIGNPALVKRVGRFIRYLQGNHVY